MNEVMRKGTLSKYTRIMNKGRGKCETEDLDRPVQTHKPSEVSCFAKKDEFAWVRKENIFRKVLFHLRLLF